MRITHVITRLIVGGAQENTIATVLGLQGTPGLEVDLISGPTHGPEGSLEPLFQSVPGTLTVLPSLVRPIHPFYDSIAAARLTAMFKSAHPAIVHTHSGKAGILGRWAAKAAKVPVIIHTIHGPSFGDFQGAIANFLFRAAERRVGRYTTHFVSVADAMTRQYLAAGIGSPSQYTRIFSGFPIEPFVSAGNSSEMRDKLQLSPTDFVVGKIARLFELKGHDDLLDVAPELVARCPNIKFLFVGDGLWRKRLETRVQDMRLGKHFIFAGLVPPEQIPQYIGAMDAVVHLSRREGLARALSQALAAGRPVVAYDCDGAREVCIDGETGFLIQVNDRKRLTEKILCLATNVDLRKRLGAQGQTFARSHFAVEKMVGDLRSLYASFETKIRK